MSTLPTLTGSGVTLRPPVAGDVSARLALGRDPEFVTLVGGDPASLGPLTAAEAAAQIEAVRAADAGWCIEIDGAFAGHVALHSLDASNRRARLAIGIVDRNWWGRGIGEASIRLVLGHAVEEMGLHRVDLRVLEENARAIRCYEKCGFRIEGREREGALIAGAWRTDLMMSILEDEWRLAGG